MFGRNKTAVPNATEAQMLDAMPTRSVTLNGSASEHDAARHVSITASQLLTTAEHLMSVTAAAADQEQRLSIARELFAAGQDLAALAITKDDTVRALTVGAGKPEEVQHDPASLPQIFTDTMLRLIAGSGISTAQGGYRGEQGRSLLVLDVERLAKAYKLANEEIVRLKEESERLRRLSAHAIPQSTVDKLMAQLNSATGNLEEKRENLKNEWQSKLTAAIKQRDVAALEAERLKKLLEVRRAPIVEIGTATLTLQSIEGFAQKPDLWICTPVDSASLAAANDLHAGDHYATVRELSGSYATRFSIEPEWDDEDERTVALRKAVI